MPTATEILSDAAGGRFGKSIGAVLVTGVMGVIIAGFQNTITFINSVGRSIFGPIDALTDQVIRVPGATVGGFVDIVEQGVRTTVVSIAPGQAWAIGPLTFALSIAFGGAGLYVVAILLQRAATSDLVLGMVSDVPFIGADEEDDDDD